MRVTKTSLVLAGAILIASPTLSAESFLDKKLTNIIGAMDENKDKKINFEEYFKGTFTKNDDSLDVNKDGYITSGEVAIEIKEDLVDTVNELRKHGVSERDTNATIISELNAVEKDAETIVKKMDSDNDSLVEPEEIKAYKRKQFNKLDRNKDGVLSLADTDKKSNYKGYPIRRKY